MSDQLPQLPQLPPLPAPSIYHVGYSGEHMTEYATAAVRLATGALLEEIHRLKQAVDQ
jgi:hypothetical protein